MKRVFLVGFRGGGFRNSVFAQEDPLIKAGHVGLFFENEKGLIYGFHPTAEASAAVGGEKNLIEKLKNHEVVDGCLQNDTHIFERAQELYVKIKNGTIDLPEITQDRSDQFEVWMYEIELPDNEFERVRQLVTQWYNEQTRFNYTFPHQQLNVEWDNCVTFPRRLNLPILGDSGQIQACVEVFKAKGALWDR